MPDQENIGAFITEDIEKNKVIAAIAYIIFFLPLIICPDSPFGKFHANQGLLLLSAAIVGNIVLGFIPVIGWILIPLLSIAVFIVGIMGLVNAATGKAKEIPVIGKYRIFK